MAKRILITGATDGIGLTAAKMLATSGHELLLHGRNSEKMEKVIEVIKEIDSNLKVKGYLADFSILADVKNMADQVLADNEHIDVLINNAGIYVARNTETVDGLELRFAVNTIAPYLLTQLLLPIMNETGRVVNLSSAAQAPVSIEALTEARRMSNDSAYAQSKLGITIWTVQMAKKWADEGGRPSVVAVNPKSFLGSKMVKEAYGTAGHDIRIGGDILCRATLGEEFEDASGKYFDNDRGIFAMPHPDALDDEIGGEMVKALDGIIDKYLYKQE